VKAERAKKAEKAERQMEEVGMIAICHERENLASGPS
jgi:hypothetical protein